MTAQLARQAGNAVIWRATELVGVQIIFLIRLFVLALLLSPDDFGLLAIATTVIAFLMAVTNFGMVPALVQRAQIDPRHYDVAWTVGVLRALGVAVVVLAAAPIAASIFDEPRAVAIIRALAVIPLLDAAVSIKLADLTRALEFRALAMIGVAQTLANTLVAVLLAPILGVWALVAGVTAGSGAHLIASYIVAPHSPRILFDRDALAPLIRFGRWIFVMAIVSQLGSFALRAAISRELGTGALGLFFLASNIGFLPAQVASQVAGSVAFPLFVRLQFHLRLVRRAFQTLLTGIAVLLIPASVLLIVLAPLIVDHLLDFRWTEAAPLIRILALIGLIGLFGETTVPLFNGLGKPGRVALLEFVQSLFIVTTASWLARSHGLVGVTLALFLGTLSSQIVSAVYVRRMLRHPFRGVGVRIAFVTAAACVGGIIAHGVGSVADGLVSLVLAGIAGTAAAGAILWSGNARLRLGLLMDIAAAFPHLAALVRTRANDGT